MALLAWLQVEGDPAPAAKKYEVEILVESLNNELPLDHDYYDVITENSPLTLLVNHSAREGKKGLLHWTDREAILLSLT